jgi:hypothetical protein
MFWTPLQTPTVVHPCVRFCRAALALTALSGAALCALSGPAHADTIIKDGAAVTIMPGSPPTRTAGNWKIAVISATDTGGDADMAQRAMIAANAALATLPDYIPVPVGDVASALRSLNRRSPLIATDYQALGKKLKAPRVMSISVTGGAQGDASATYSALAELYDTTTGGLVGRGQVAFTATPENAPKTETGTDVKLDSAAPATAPATTNGVAMATAQTLRERALDSAVLAAVAVMDQPAQLHGVVVSISSGARARLSLGDRSTLRNGARVEYLMNSQPIAYGTVIDVGPGEAVATIAPEAAAPAVRINTEFRTVTNPSVVRAGKSQAQIDEAAWNRFERNFGIVALAALAVYKIYRD